MSKVVAIVQARMGSARFPGKVLAELDGEPVIEHVLKAARFASGVDEVVLAMSTAPADDVLYHRTYPSYLRDLKFYRGPEQDVLRRFYEAARLAAATTVVRLTGDCPLVDREVITRSIRILDATQAHFVTNDTRVSGWADGMDVETFTFLALADAHHNATEPEDREHVTRWLLNNRPHLVMMKRPAMTGPKLSVDTPADLDVVRSYLQAQRRQPA